ncbi:MULTISPECIES: N-acetylmuramoyl-L-alanine amidase-like domain-containing protein [Providencia]|nr:MULTISPECIES: N-acetylmuramoyl-L-alanine amidase-like domain-containing protein [Providencia]WEB84732.1 DUF1460 domain-containing protein [Providencia rettgeri]
MYTKNSNSGRMRRLVTATLMLLMVNYVQAQVVLTSGSHKILTSIFNQQNEMQRYHSTSAEKIDVLTQYFLNTPYDKQTLNMSPLFAENLVVNLEAMDCMTFIEYVEAFKGAENSAQFFRNLTSIRYFNQDVTYKNRRHFFSDWAQGDSAVAEDITAKISPYAVNVSKQLNLKGNRKTYILGLPITYRDINYIPSKYIDNDLITRLKTGDYIGIYSTNRGLDVSHVGIVIQKGNKTIFRNASSLRENFKVSDVELQHYIQGKEGIIVFRSKIDY